MFVLPKLILKTTIRFFASCGPTVRRRKKLFCGTSFVNGSFLCLATVYAETVSKIALT